jgi:6-phosphogluconate dehydrogenase
MDTPDSFYNLNTGHVMELGMIGLGRMGANMARRLTQAGHTVVGYTRQPEKAEALVHEEVIARGVTSFVELVNALTQPRAIWLMLPAAIVDATLHDLMQFLDADDMIVDGGNSYYVDDIRRAAQLKVKGIEYIDCGTSGGIWGTKRGYCLMIGGKIAAVKRLDPIFAALAPGVAAAPHTPGRESTGRTVEQGYLHCGSYGAGHFVKMVHNGIEYGMMASYTEGLNILHHANIGKQSHQVDAETAPLRNPEFYQYDFNLADIAQVWRRGSVISSWLLDLIAIALLEDPDLTNFGGRVSDSGEGRWTLIAAIEEAVPVPVLSAALYTRFSSRGQSDFANKLISALRYEFGEHLE